MENMTLYGIAYGCPAGKRDNDCPLLAKDHLSFNEKVDWIKSLSEREQLAIEEYHKRCSGRKEKTKILFERIWKKVKV
jgi:hypothetical protein